MRIVVGKSKSRSRLGIFIKWPHSVLEASRFTHNRDTAIAQGNQPPDTAGLIARKVTNRSADA